MDYEKIRQVRRASDPSYIREALPVEFVAEIEGIELEDRGSRLVGLCPFHTDSNPSFQVYNDENNISRFSCFPCGKFGDVIDFVRELYSLDFHKGMEKCASLINDKPQGWTPSVLSLAPVVNFNEEVLAAQGNSLQPFIDLVDYKKWPIDPELIADIFGIGCIDGGTVIPFYDEGNVVGYKIRNKQNKLSAPGSKFRTFYGEWMDQGRENVVLTEGEPDTWAAVQHAGWKWDVLGLPTGAGSRINTDPFIGRNVVLALDGDEAGRTATIKWVDALTGVANDVKVVLMPDNYDLAMLDDVEGAIEGAKSLLPYTGSVFLRNGVFQRAMKTKDGTNYENLSNWGFTPKKELRIAEGGVAYEGTISPTGESVVITSDDLSSSGNLHSWSQHYGLGWRGTDKDARDILIYLESLGPLLSPGKMTKVLGLHDNQFILPNETIGEEEWVFLPKPGIVTAHLNYEVHDNFKEVLTQLFKLHRPEVIHPLLAWLAAAPLRSRFDEFPILAITGSSGAGKTTLTKTIINSFSGGAIGGKDGISLADTTKHAITENVGATNAIPVWFDEYRASIKSETRDALHNSLLAAYIGQTTSKGSVTPRGLGVTNWEHNAPIIVSGENSFEETAHVERMILLHLPVAGRNAGALHALRALGPSGIPIQYLRWLIYKADKDIKVRPAYNLDLPSRVQNNVGVLNVGWALLRDFMIFNEMTDPGEPNWDLIINEAKLAAMEDPILEAVKWAIESQGSNREVLAAVKEGWAYIRVEPLVATARREGRFALPGNAKAVRRVLEEKYEGQDITTTLPMIGLLQQTRFTAIPASILGLV